MGAVSAEALERATAEKRVRLGDANTRAAHCCVCHNDESPGNARVLWLNGKRHGYVCIWCADPALWPLP